MNLNHTMGSVAHNEFECFENLVRSQPHVLAFARIARGAKMVRKFFPNWAINPVTGYN